MSHVNERSPKNPVLLRISIANILIRRRRETWIQRFDLDLLRRECRLDLDQS